MGIDRKANTLANGAPQRGHEAPLERLAQLGDALGGVGAVPMLVDAAQRVTVQAAKKTKEVCQRALTRKQTLWGRRRT